MYIDKGPGMSSELSLGERVWGRNQRRGEGTTETVRRECSQALLHLVEAAALER